MPLRVHNLRPKLDYAFAKLRYGWKPDSKGEIKNLKNLLPNSGGFPVEEISTVTPEKIFASIEDQHNRGTETEGFEGLALDDALAFTNEYKHYTFFYQAKAIAKIAREVSPDSQISVLELGCGGGDMLRFFRALGIQRYLGVDGNPVAFKHSPFIKENSDHFRLLNLQEEINFGTKFSVVCTFEVLEHICEDKLDNIMRTARNHMDQNSIFLGTASLQDDLDVHITVRPRPFWIEKFAQNGLVPHENHDKYERLLIDNHPFNWNGENTNVFALRLA